MLLGPVALLTHRDRRLLLLLGAVSLVEGYDLSIVTIALPQLRSSFHLSQAQGSWWLAVLYLGSVPAFLLARQADRVGRRRLLLVSMLAYTVLSAATALAPTIETFAACQFAARAFLSAQIAITWTIAAEELPSGARGFGFGCLATADAIGTGACALLWGTLLAPSGASWRWLYAGAATLLVVVVLVWRHLPETARFVQISARGALARSWQLILKPPHRRRLLLLVATGFLISLTTQATVFVVDFMETERHLSATTANLMLVAAGACALPVLVVAGGLSDRFGRKRVACTFLIASALGPVIFFNLAHGVLELFGALALTYAAIFGAWPTASAFAPELFPTSLRALGGSVTNAARVAGQSGSFAMAAVFIGATSSLPLAVTVLCLGPIISAIIIACAFPETSGRELEAISEGAISPSDKC